jgi:hypothetical protein
VRELLHAEPEEGGIVGLSILRLAESLDPRSNRVNERDLQPSSPSKLVRHATGTPGAEKQFPGSCQVHFIRSFGMPVSGQSPRSFCKSE